MRFPTSSGMATWCRDNMAVRHEQAVHINDGTEAEEPKRNEVTDDGDHQIFRCDLPLMDDAHAADAFSTINGVMGWAVPLGDEAGPSWVEHHTCHHDETPGKPCEVVSREDSS